MTDDIKTLVALISQSRIEDRKDLDVMKSDMKELVKSVNTLTNATTKYFEHQRHTDKEIEEIKDRVDVLEVEVSEVKIVQAGNNRNWAILGSAISVIFAGLVGYYFTVTKPVQDSNLKSDEIKELIEEINGKL